MQEQTPELRVKKHISKIDNLRTLIRRNQKVIREELLKDNVYKSIKDQVKDLSNKLENEKGRIMRDPMLTETQNNIDGLKNELEGHQVTLVEYLSEFSKKGKTVVEDEQGRKREIVKNFKLKK